MLNDFSNVVHAYPVAQGIMTAIFAAAIAVSALGLFKLATAGRQRCPDPLAGRM